MTYEVTMYVRGGAIRDAIIGTECNDIDFLAIGDYDDVVAYLAKKYTVLPIGKRHNTCVVLDGKHRYEVTVLDEPSKVVEHSDFTMNALLFDGERIIDYCGGVADIEAKLIRQCTPDSIFRDPIRALRAIRFKHAYGFVIESNTKQAIEYVMPRIVLCNDQSEYSVSKYRSWNELQKHFELGKGPINELCDLGLQMPFGKIESEAKGIQAIVESLKGVSERKLVYRKVGIPMKTRNEIERLIVCCI